MRILRVVYGVYTSCSDQSDFIIWYNYIVFYKTSSVGATLSLSLIFCLLLYSAILEISPYYSPQHANYCPIILINNPHLLVRNENSHIHTVVHFSSNKEGSHPEQLQQLKSHLI